MPGAVLLAALGAMRARAGKLQIVSAESRAGALAVAMPEAFGHQPARNAKWGVSSVRPFQSSASRWADANALLVGPGMVEEPDCHEILKCLLDTANAANIVVDAGAFPRITELGDSLCKRVGRIIITPHAGEYGEPA